MKLSTRQFMTASILALIASIAIFFQNCAPHKANSIDMSSTSRLLSISPRIDGRCNPTINTCQAGNLQNIADSSTQSLWQCVGTGGGKTVTCSTSFSTSAVNGICGGSVNNCVQGFMVDVLDTTTDQLWRCDGFNGGASAPCGLARTSTQRLQNGQCSQTNVNSCVSGNFVDMTDENGLAMWQCTGVLGGTTANCAMSPTGSGNSICGSTINTCNSGRFLELADTPQFYIWQCHQDNGSYQACSIAKPTCQLSVQELTHAGENYTFNVTAANTSSTSDRLSGNLTLKVYGSKTDPNGSNFVEDANGTGSFQISTQSPIALSYLHAGGQASGNYTRRFEIYDAQGVQICQTNQVSYKLTPACSLSATDQDITIAESFAFNANFALDGEKALAAIPARVAFYGTFTDASGAVTQDETGLNSYSPQQFPLVIGPFPGQTNKIGSYSRYYTARDAANNVLCKSNTVQIQIADVPAPPPPPPPPPPEPTMQNCSVGGATINHGASLTFYESSKVAFDQTCVSEQRTCTNGQLSGSFTNLTCTPDEAPTPICDIYYQIQNDSGVSAIGKNGNYVAFRNGQDKDCNGGQCGIRMGISCNAGAEVRLKYQFQYYSNQSAEVMTPWSGLSGLVQWGALAGLQNSFHVTDECQSPLMCGIRVEAESKGKSCNVTYQFFAESIYGPIAQNGAWSSISRSSDGDENCDDGLGCGMFARIDCGGGNQVGSGGGGGEIIDGDGGVIDGGGGVREVNQDTIQF